MLLVQAKPVQILALIRKLLLVLLFLNELLMIKKQMPVSAAILFNHDDKFFLICSLSKS